MTKQSKYKLYIHVSYKRHKKKKVTKGQKNKQDW